MPEPQTAAASGPATPAGARSPRSTSPSPAACRRWCSIAGRGVRGRRIRVGSGEMVATNEPWLQPFNHVTV